jgi:tetratricopeptide (TPR) repeat protein
MVALSAEDPMLRALAVRLDWSPASVAGIDACLDAMFGTAGEAPDQDNWRPSPGRYQLIVGFGSYLGEVCRAVVGGTWEEDPEQPHPLRARLLTPTGMRLFPLSKLYRRFQNGASDSAFSLLLLVTREQPAVRRAWGKGFLALAERAAAQGAMPGEQRLPLAVGFCRTAVGLDPSLGEAKFLEFRLATLVKDHPDTGAATVRAEPTAPSRPAAPAATPSAPAVAAADAQQALALLAQAVGAVNAGRPADALPLITRARALDPTNFNCWQNHGVCLCMLGQYAEALPFIERACVLAPNEVFPWQTRATIMFELDRPVEAMAFRKQVTRLAPKVPSHWRDLAWACNLAKRYQDAIDHLTTYLELVPADPEALLEKLVIYDRMGVRQAAGTLALLIFNNPDHVARLKRKPIDEYFYLISPEMSPELKKMLGDVLR